MMSRFSSSVSRATLGVVAVCGFSLALPAAAATPATATGASIAFSPAAPFRYETAGVSSSSEDAIAEERSNLAGDGAASGEGALGAQPPTGRRRSYGRSRYQDRLHNADGSTKIAFVAGAGLNVPVANTGKFYTPSYAITAGAGYNFNKMFGVLGEFHYDHMGLTGGAIAVEYNNAINSGGASASDLVGLDANAHFIALTANPVVTFSSDRSRLGAYITAGGGYYRKTTNFTLPSYGTDYYGYTYASNENVDSATANGVGANGGFGLTYKLSSFSTERLFLEARYHWMSINSANNPDFFPYNRRNSEFIPITAGIRF